MQDSIGYVQQSLDQKAAEQKATSRQLFDSTAQNLTLTAECTDLREQVTEGGRTDERMLERIQRHGETEKDLRAELACV